MATDEQQQGAMEALGDDLKSLPRNFLRGILRPPAVRQRAANLEATQTANQAAQQQIAARNALAEMMGDPGAADPSGYAQVQQPGLTRTTQAIQAQQAGTAATREERLAAAQQQELEAEEAERNRTRMVNSARILRDRMGAAQEAGASPEQLGQIFDATAPIIQRVDPTVGEEELGFLREQAVQDPAILDQIIDAFSPQQNLGGGIRVERLSGGRLLQINPDGSREIVMDPGTGEEAISGQQAVAETRADQAETRLDIQQRRAEIAEAGENRAQQAFIEEAEADEAAQRSRLENLDRVSSMVVRDGETLLDLAEQSRLMKQRDTEFGNIAAGAATTVASLLPRSTTNAAQRQIDTLRANIAVDQLLNIKREGSGLGQVPQSQLTLLGDLLGDLDVNTQPEILQRNVQQIVSLYQDIVDRSAEDLQQLEQRSTERREALGREPAPGAAPESAPTMRRNPETGVWEMTNGN